MLVSYGGVAAGAYCNLVVGAEEEGEQDVAGLVVALAAAAIGGATSRPFPAPPTVISVTVAAAARPCSTGAACAGQPHQAGVLLPCRDNLLAAACDTPTTRCCRRGGWRGEH